MAVTARISRRMTRNNPGIHVPPPLIFAAFFFLGYAFRRFLSFDMLATWPLPPLLVLVAAGILLWGMATMARARTAILPNRPASALVADGPFRFSRNPLYVAMTILYVAAALWTGSGTSLLLLPVVIAVMQVFVIRREERYLESRFGEEYRSYCRRVRRWI